jgi:hypothetical protein
VCIGVIVEVSNCILQREGWVGRERNCKQIIHLRVTTQEKR